MDLLAVHNHFKTEVKVDPKIGLNGFATMDDFVNEIVSPRNERVRAMAETFERNLLEEALRLGCWRIVYVQWSEYGDSRIDSSVRVWPITQAKEAVAFAREKCSTAVTLSFARWLEMSDESFFCESRGSANYGVALRLRKFLRRRYFRKHSNRRCKSG